MLVWDEISMSSKRLFNVNIINQKIMNNNIAFGGIQMALVGDFWQLKPIPNSIDAGVPIFESNLFNKVFPHRYELMEISFLSCECSLPANEVAIHIYFKCLPVDIHNAEVLASLDGLKIMFESRDTRKAKLLDITIDRVLYLKSGCRIMLMCNINDQLKNGCCGVCGRSK